MSEYYDDDYEILEVDLNDILFGNDLEVDPRAQEMFTDAFFNGNEQSYIELVDYMWDQYGIDFEGAFDWEDFRAWYDAA